MDQNVVRGTRGVPYHERRISKPNELPMNLVDVEFTYDVNKIIFYFTADGRIDFKELVKDLAGIFRTRLGCTRLASGRGQDAGRHRLLRLAFVLCHLLGDFEPVSIKMAKNQNLSLNPTKISGICGRLMCCLKYEGLSVQQGSQI